MPTTQTRAEPRRGNTLLVATVRSVNRCIEACIDCEKDFALAAADVRDRELKHLFMRFEREHASFVVALQHAVTELGAYPENEGSTFGIAHRGWSALVRMITTRNLQTILEQSIETELRALRTYNDILDHVGVERVMRGLRGMLERQRTVMHSALSDLRSRAARAAVH